MRFVINAGLCFATALGLFIIGAVIGTMTAAAHETPWLEGETKAPQCQEALRIADRAYRSKAFYLHESRGWPAHMTSAPVLYPAAAFNGAERDGVTAHADVFDMPDRTYGQAYTYWQTRPHLGIRLVLDEESIGWRGDLYNVYAVPAGLDRANFDIRKQYGVKDELKPGAEQLWEIPTILRSADGSLWVLHPEGGGQHSPAGHYLTNWIVLAVRHGALKPICTVRFVEHQTNALGLLPPEVKTLADSLDVALGQEPYPEGEESFTDELRILTQQAWANTVLRPWAMSRKPYNSRREVDAYLKKWSQGGMRSLSIYRSIRRQFPVARQALATTYVVRFGKTQAQADALAARTLDIAYRSYFVFRHDGLIP